MNDVKNRTANSNQSTSTTNMTQTKLEPVKAVATGKPIQLLPNSNSSKSKNVTNTPNKFESTTMTNSLNQQSKQSMPNTTTISKGKTVKKRVRKGVPRKKNSQNSKHLSTTFHDKVKVYHKQLPLYMYAHMMKHLYFPTDYYTHFDQFLKRWQRFIDTQEQRDKLKLKYINTSQIILPSMKSSDKGDSLTKILAERMSKMKKISLSKMGMSKLSSLKMPKISNITNGMKRLIKSNKNENKLSNKNENKLSDINTPYSKYSFNVYKNALGRPKIFKGISKMLGEFEEKLDNQLRAYPQKRKSSKSNLKLKTIHLPEIDKGEPLHVFTDYREKIKSVFPNYSDDLIENLNTTLNIIALSNKLNNVNLVTEQSILVKGPEIDSIIENLATSSNNGRSRSGSTSSINSNNNTHHTHHNGRSRSGSTSSESSLSVNSFNSNALTTRMKQIRGEEKRKSEEEKMKSDNDDNDDNDEQSNSPKWKIPKIDMKGGDILKLPEDGGNNGNNLCWLNAPLYVFLSNKNVVNELSKILFTTHKNIYDELKKDEEIIRYLQNSKSSVKTLDDYYNSDKILTAKEISEIANLEPITTPGSGDPITNSKHVFQLNNFLHMHNRVLSMIKLIEYRNHNIWNGETYKELIRSVFSVLSEYKFKILNGSFQSAGDLTHMLMDIFNGKVFNEVKITKTDYFKFEEKLYRPINEQSVWSQISDSLINRNDDYSLLGMIVGDKDLNINSNNMTAIHASVTHYTSIVSADGNFADGNVYKFDSGNLNQVKVSIEQLLNPRTDELSKYVGLILHNPNPTPY